MSAEREIKILVLNGPNLDMLGSRDPSQYGTLCLEDIESLISKSFPLVSFEFFQSNIEGCLIEKIHQAAGVFQGLIINPGGYAHSSVAIRDALELLPVPKVEVHLSNLANREDFRQKTITASACTGYISGFKEKGYLAAVNLLLLYNLNED